MDLMKETRLIYEIYLEKRRVELYYYFDGGVLSGAEYMILLLSDGQRKEIRLDHIKKVSSQ